MAAWSQISTSNLVGSIRLDAEFWQPAYLTKEKVIRSGEHIALGALVSTFKKGIFYILAREYADKGVPFYRSSNVGTILPKEEGLAFITPAKHREEYKTALETGDLMMVKTGRSGASVVLVRHCNVSQDVIAVKVRRERVNPYFLALYLNTSFGSSEMNRWFQGQVQPHLSLEDARRIWIALVPDKVQVEIETMVKNSARLRNEAEEAYAKSKQLLEAELGLDKLTFQKPVGYTARFSDLELSRRFDSEHYYPAFDNMKEKLPKHVQLAPLGSFLTFCRRGKQPIYSESGLPVLNSKHILENKITLEGNRYAKPNAESGLQIQYGDVLINGTGRGTIGRTAPYLVNEHQAIPDNHVTILRSPVLDPAYLSFYLNSQAGKLQVEKHQRGSSGQLELYPFDVRKFQVWGAPQSIQHEIRRLYERAIESAKRSRELLEQSKSRVERLIEEGAQS